MNSRKYFADGIRGSAQRRDPRPLGGLPEERAVADGHYSLASWVLFILQAGYFKAKTLFFSFEMDQVAEDVKHVLQQHYPQHHDAALKSAIVKQTRHAQQRKLLELYDYHACAGAERAALGAKADQVVRISAKLKGRVNFPFWRSYTLVLASVGDFLACADSAGMRARRASSGSLNVRTQLGSPLKHLA